MFAAFVIFLTMAMIVAASVRATNVAGAVVLRGECGECSECENCGKEIEFEFHEFSFEVGDKASECSLGASRETRLRGGRAGS